MIRLGVNLDHIATLRQARGTKYPSPVQAVLLAELAGADNITCHLREDRRHIQDQDVFFIKDQSNLPLNFEMAATDEMVKIAFKLKPESVTLVPEKRQELTTEGGLFFGKEEKSRLRDAVVCLREQGTVVSFFIDPDKKSIDEAKNLEPQAIEVHTGGFCDELDRLQTTKEKHMCTRELSEKTEYARSLGFQVHVGHGISYTTAAWFQLLKGVEEANVGHSIISRSVFSGLEKAVFDMKNLLNHSQYKPKFL